MPKPMMTKSTRTAKTGKTKPVARTTKTTKTVAVANATHAYTMLEDEPESGQYSVGICERGVAGYRLVPDYGPYEDKARTSGIVGRLNERLGVSAEEAEAIVNSTFAKPFKAKKAAGGRR